MVLNELLVKYSKAINNLPMKRLYEKIIIYFYNKLISCGNSNIDHINMFSWKYSFTEFPFDFYTCICYLLKRSPKFLRFMFDDSILLPLNKVPYGYNIEKTLESQFDITIFTFNYIFDLNSDGSYVNSFDDIISQLFNQLTLKTFISIDIPNSTLKYDYITKRLDWILQFYEKSQLLLLPSLAFSKIIKSFEYSNLTLELIVNKFIVVEYIFSNFNFTIPCLRHHGNSNNNFIYDMYLELEYLLNNHYGIIKNIKTIEYDYKISNYSNYSLIFLDQFIDFLNQNQNEYLLFIDPLTNSRNQVLDNFIISLSFQCNESPINILPKNEKFNFNKEIIIEILLQQDCQLLIKNKREQFLISLKIKEEKKFKQLEKFYIEDMDNPFLKGFINGEIKYCELVKKYYPNQFKITKSSITKAISFDNIHILKYYYQENNCIGLSNSFKSDIQLFEFLILELKNHQDYKLYLEWL
ncbi:hypothetical protein ACTFIY_002308 [Dictyostelium cf. discoideum]